MLVVGGGIGGLAASIAVRRAGIEVEVVESKPDASVYGVGIIQPSNQLRALAELGLLEDCLESGGGFPGWEIYDQDSRFLAAVPCDNVVSPDVPPINGITRPKLHAILLAAMDRLGIPLRFNTTWHTLHEEEAGIEVAFTDGSTGRYDLVIGADGAWSKLRTLLYGDRYELRHTGQGVWRYNLPRPADMKWGRVYYGNACKVGLTPMSPSTMYMFVVTAEPEGRRVPEHTLAAEMRGHLHAYDGLVGELREMITDPAEVVFRPISSGLVPESWRRGRILLIGDAVHATTPHLSQGATLAIEDAVLLGRLLATGMDFDALAEEYMQRRLPRARLVCESSERIGRWELLEWAGTPDPNSDLGGELGRATQQMMAPI